MCDSIIYNSNLDYSGEVCGEVSEDEISKKEDDCGYVDSAMIIYVSK